MARSESGKCPVSGVASVWHGYGVRAAPGWGGTRIGGLTDHAGLRSEDA
jgi:hypothetical protein